MFEKDFFDKNRKKVADMMEPGSIALFFSGVNVRKSGDVFYPFFANRNFYYLTGINESEDILVIQKDYEGDIKEYFFVKQVSQETERWFGRRLTEDNIYKISGLSITGYRDDFSVWIITILQNNQYTLYLDYFYYDERYEYSEVYSFFDNIKKRLPWLKISDIHSIMCKIRTIKEDEEIQEMRDGISICRNAFIRLMTEARVGMTEYQLKALWDYEVASKGVRDMAFQPIITSGENNFIIHYSDYTRTIVPGDVILCDTGVNWNGVCCDISRAWPIDDWFTNKQELFYRCMLACSKELFQFVKPGRAMKDIYKEQRHIMRRKIVEFGIASNEEDANKLIWHGGAHHIGFDNHDEVYIENHAYDLIKKNMVFAIDIGIYDVENNIGFRLEDNCLVTELGSENLTRDIPYELDELKEMMNARRF